MPSGIVYSNTQRHDPVLKFRFLVEFVATGGNNISIKSGFQKVSGLKADIDVTEYREGGDNITKHKIPGLVKFDAITLERGVSENKDMFNEFTKMFSYSANPVNSPSYKFSMRIKLLDRDGQTVIKTWNVKECWISSYEFGDLDASSNDVVIEKMVVQHEGFELA